MATPYSKGWVLEGKGPFAGRLPVLGSFTVPDLQDNSTVCFPIDDHGNVWTMGLEAWNADAIIGDGGTASDLPNLRAYDGKLSDAINKANGWTSRPGSWSVNQSPSLLLPPPNEGDPAGVSRVDGIRFVVSNPGDSDFPEASFLAGGDLWSRTCSIHSALIGTDVAAKWVVKAMEGSVTGSMQGVSIGFETAGILGAIIGGVADAVGTASQEYAKEHDRLHIKWKALVGQKLLTASKPQSQLAGTGTFIPHHVDAIAPVMINKSVAAPKNNLVLYGAAALALFALMSGE